jgi:hypothetical protein
MNYIFLADAQVPWWSTLVSTIVGGLIAVLGGTASTFWTKYLDQSRERAQYAAALYGELQIVLEIIEKRNFQQNLKQTIEIMDRTKQMTPLQITVRESFLAVYLNNVSKIGSLPGQLPTEITRIYGILFSVLEDLKYLNDIKIADPSAAAEFAKVMTIQRSVYDWVAELIVKIKTILPQLARVANDYPQ